MESAVRDLYGNRVRVRVCGLCWRGDQLLMVNHRGLSGAAFWAPPGGGLEFGESVSACLRREFMEETGLEISTGRFMFACEFIGDPLHAIELFFEVSVTGGELRKGNDPELAVIEEVRFMTPREITALPESGRHGIFQPGQSAGELKSLSGFFRV